MRPSAHRLAALLALLALPLSAEDSLPLSSDRPDLEQRLVDLKEQANGGDLHAAQQLYMRYAVAGLTEQARAWAARYNDLLAQQADSGDTRAMMQLGSRYLTGGDYTPQSLEKAATWFSRAAEAGAPSAAYVLGEIFARQGNVPMSAQAYEQAYKLYSKALQDDPQNPDTLYWLGFMEQNGIGTPRQAEAGIAKLTQAAERGSAWASAHLFKTYLNGIGTPPNEAKAYDFARKLADERQDGAMAYIVATAYLQGNGPEQNEQLGEHYLDIAVRANMPDAIYVKANRLERADRMADALPLYRQAASMQQREALVRMGTLLLQGAEGVEQDEARGLSMLNAAGSRFESPQAAWELTQYYDRVGESELSDSWCVAASNRGIASAMARRGLLHLIPGSCVTWSPTETYRWWRIGKQAGDSTCALYINLFLHLFTPLLLLLVFGLPAYLSYRANKKG